MNSSHFQQLLPGRRAAGRRRAGSTWWLMLGAIAAMAVIGGVTWYFVGSAGESIGTKPVLAQVVNEAFDHVVIEPGEIESSDSVEIKCQVKSKNTGGTEITWVIEEGTLVKKGDKLVELDSSLLQQDLDQQLITCTNSEALVTEAQNLLNAAEIALKGYKEGTYVQERKLIMNEIFVANENLQRTMQSIQSNERLASRGLTDDLQIQADQFAKETALNNLELARTKLKTLDDFTSQEMVTTLESAIKTARAKLKAAEQSHALELKKKEELESQVAACTIVSPVDGQVVYANVYSSRGNSEFVVEQGARVTEGKAIIRIPNPEMMQVKAKINESRITRIQEGLPAIVRIDALPDSKLPGIVTHVNKYPEPGGFGTSPVKQYATYVKILDPPPIIRSGMTAEASIYVEQRPKALQIPVQAVVEHKGKFFCLVESGKDKYETREIKIGASNDKMLTVESDDAAAPPLKAGEMVVMNPRAHKTLLALPDLPDVERVHVPEGQVAQNDSPGRGQGRGRAGARGGRGGAGGARGAAGGGRGGAGGAGGQLPQLDTNGDGKLSADELSAVPEQFRSRMMENDTNGDGELDQSELQAMRARFQGGAGGSRAGGAE